MENCGLCIAFKKGSQVIDESDLCFSMVNYEPMQKGHVMVVPKRHVELLADFSDDEIKDFFRMIDKTRKLVEKSHDNGVLILLNGKKFKSQNHFHMHIVPVPEGLREIMSKYNNSPVRKKISEEEMKETREHLLKNLRD
ncbi:MAG: HIT family protein [archaeon]